MFCGKCGTKHSEGSGFCGNCGSKLATENFAPTFQKPNTSPLKKSKKIWVGVVLIVLVVAAGSFFVRQINTDPLVGTWAARTGVENAMLEFRSNGTGVHSWSLAPRTVEEPFRWTRVDDYAVIVEIQRGEGRPLALEFEIRGDRIFLSWGYFSGTRSFDRVD